MPHHLLSNLVAHLLPHLNKYRNAYSEWNVKRNPPSEATVDQRLPGPVSAYTRLI